MAEGDRQNPDEFMDGLKGSFSGGGSALGQLISDIFNALTLNAPSASAGLADRPFADDLKEDWDSSKTRAPAGRPGQDMPPALPVDAIRKTEEVLGVDISPLDKDSLANALAENNRRKDYNAKLKKMNNELKEAEEQIERARQKRERAKENARRKREREMERKNRGRDTRRTAPRHFRIDPRRSNRPAKDSGATENIFVTNIRTSKSLSRLYVHIAQSAAKAFGLDVNMFANQIYAESSYELERMGPPGKQPRYNEDGKHEDNMPGRAYGPGQFWVFDDWKKDKDIERVYGKYGLKSMDDVMNPETAIPAAAMFMAELKAKFGSQIKAAIAYNSGSSGGLLLEAAKEMGMDIKSIPDDALIAYLRQKMVQTNSQRLRTVLDYVEDIRDYNILERPLAADGTKNFAEKRKTHKHAGEDYPAYIGQPLYAVARGQVTYVGEVRGYGNTVIIEHDNDVRSLYAHLDSYGAKKGAHLEKGQFFAKAGDTGRSKGPHLHFEVQVKGKDGKWYLIPPEEAYNVNLSNPVIRQQLIDKAKKHMGKQVHPTTEGLTPEQFGGGGTFSRFWDGMFGDSSGDVPEETKNLSGNFNKSNSHDHGEHIHDEHIHDEPDTDVLSAADKKTDFDSNRHDATDASHSFWGRPDKGKNRKKDNNINIG